MAAHRLVLGVLVLLNSQPILVSLDCSSHSITMKALTPTPVKTAKIHRSEHSPAHEHLRNFSNAQLNFQQTFHQTILSAKITNVRQQ